MSSGTEDNDSLLAETILRAKTGDREAFDIIVNLLAGRLLSICKSYCYGRDFYQDVSSQVWIEVWRSLPKFTGTTIKDIMNYAVKIARYRSIEFFRKENRHVGGLPQDKDGRTFEPASSDIPELNRLVLEEEVEAIKQCIESKANPKSLDTWRLHRLEQKEYGEIAKMLGIAEGTVGSRIKRVEDVIAGCMEGRGL